MITTIRFEADPSLPLSLSLSLSLTQVLEAPDLVAASRSQPQNPKSDVHAPENTKPGESGRCLHLLLPASEDIPPHEAGSSHLAVLGG